MASTSASRGWQAAIAHARTPLPQNYEALGTFARTAAERKSASTKLTTHNGRGFKV